MDQNSNCICYFDDNNRAFFAKNMIFFGAKSYLGAFHATHLGELEHLVDYHDKHSPTQQTLQIMTAFTFSVVPDWVRIIICFENYMKAFLIKDGYLIHKIDKNYLNVKTLANQQNKRPVSLSEFSQINDFSFDNESQSWILEGISYPTIDFTTLLKRKYQEIINVPVQILRTIHDINVKRNSLHFYHEAKITYDKKFIQELKTIDEFVKKDMMNVYGELESKVSMPS